MGEVRTCRGEMRTCRLPRMASMGGMREARWAGTQAERKSTAAERSTAAPTAAGAMTTRRGWAARNISWTMEPMQAKVILMPSQPAKRPRGMAAAPMRAASKKTLPRFWRRVAPTLESIPDVYKRQV